MFLVWLVDLFWHPSLPSILANQILLLLLLAKLGHLPTKFRSSRSPRKYGRFPPWLVPDVAIPWVHERLDCLERDNLQSSHAPFGKTGGKRSPRKNTKSKYLRGQVLEFFVLGIKTRAGTTSDSETMEDK